MTNDMQRLLNLANLLCMSDIESMDLDECTDYLDHIETHKRILKKRMHHLEMQAMDDEGECDFIA